MRKFRKPAKIRDDLTMIVPDMLRTLERMGAQLPPVIPPVYVTEAVQRCLGLCKYLPQYGTPTSEQPMIVYLNPRCFTLGKPNYHLYVLAHELAHVANILENGPLQDGHGPKFMCHFKRVCPPELWHYERLGTRVSERNALYAGISDNPADNVQRAACMPK